MNDLLIISGMPIVRSVAGWLENALADGKISLIEWKKLCKTILRLGVPAVALYYGFNLPVEFAAATPLIVDYIFNYATKAYNKAK